MNNGFERMFAMMEKMEQMMSMMDRFDAMMNGTSSTNSTPTTPQVAKAEVVDEVMTLEELLALDTSTEVKDLARERKPLEFIPCTVLPPRCQVPRRGVKYNQYTTKRVWTYNHLVIKEKYPNVKYHKGVYYCDNLSDLQVFAGHYQVIEHLSDEQSKRVDEYWASKKNK